MGRGFGRAKEQEPESYEIERRSVARYQPDHREGLTRAQAAERMAAGWSNIPVDPPAQTVKEIIRRMAVNHRLSEEKHAQLRAVQGT